MSVCVGVQRAQALTLLACPAPALPNDSTLAVSEVRKLYVRVKYTVVGGWVLLGRRVFE